MKLADTIINLTLHPDGTHSIPKRALKIKPEHLKDMYTVVLGTDRYHKGALVDRCADMWSDQLGGSLEVAEPEVYIDRNTLINIDTKQHLISDIGDKELGEMDVEQIAFSRAIAKISVPGLAEGLSPAIAINMNEKWNEFAWGNNVHVCSNMTIMKAENILSTHQKIRGAGGNYTKLSLENILRQFEQFMGQTKRRFEEELKQIAELKKRYVTRDEFHRFMGEQYTKIQWVNHHQVERKIKDIQDKFLPVNGLQLSKIAIEACRPSYREYEWEGNTTTVWNIINLGTEVLKFQRGSDSATVLRANSNWVKLVNGYDFHRN